MGGIRIPPVIQVSVGSNRGWR